MSTDLLAGICIGIIAGIIITVAMVYVVVADKKEIEAQCDDIHEQQIIGKDGYVSARTGEPVEYKPNPVVGAPDM